MPAYKTPDVYVEEISLFPPSVAQVETAVPAFIGYTQIADEFGKNDLRNVPKKITSIPEYIQFFGGAPPVVVKNVELDVNNLVSTYDVETNYYLYDSIRLFFKNGGGKCYIISVGSYEDDVSQTAITAGLGALKKKDEPTIILFPDAVLLESDAFYELQKAALDQCATLQDRVAVLDLLESKKASPNFNWEQGIEEFRSKIGINNLKYGAAYTPWLKTNLGMDIRYRDVQGKVTRAGIGLSFDTLTKDDDVKLRVADLDNAVADVNKILENIDSLITENDIDNLSAQYAFLLDDFKGNPNKAKFRLLLKFIFDVVDKIDEWTDSGQNKVIANAKLRDSITSAISGGLKAAVEKLIAYNKGAAEVLDDGFKEQDATYLYQAYDPVKAAAWGDIFGAGSPAFDATIFTGNSNPEKVKAAEPSLTQIFYQVNSAVTDIIKSAKNYESTYETTLVNAHPVLKNLLRKIATGLTTMPPSGAIAGVYAKVDATRGVWKAPANVSLNNVSDVTEIIDFADQEGLNVDPESGKSINAIRPFTGKGILVWGARTLMGNDNEWRYISVRRFFNMVEESVKKATYPFVFEPNDANTWIKIKSMIENYLIGLWRDGALFGSKPEHAFFVNVGLGTTMTAQDINEGRMIVEIGMAAVRPAEFIVLRFSHKMAEV
ncbi:phage tail sheath subtilisin-like domain-containing protein [candidate division KSB1 bacterium]|nr:phage tail sheath subtilisin-like domain-containing protein [candidate division KSB1 bacterium]